MSAEAPDGDAAPGWFRSSTDRTKGRGLFWQTLGELSSAYTAAVLIACVGVASWVAAYYERDYGMAAAHVHFYQAWWFNLIFVFMAVAVVGAVLVRLPLQRRQTGFVIVHCGLVLLIAGFWIGSANRLDGMLNAWPGTEAHLIELPTDEISVIPPTEVDGKALTWRSEFQPLEWAGYPSALRYVLKPLWPIPQVGMHELPSPLRITLPDGTEVRVLRIVDTGGPELGWGAAPGDAAAVPATRLDLAIRPPGAADFQAMGGQWLTPAGDGMLSRGPMTATLAQTSSAQLVEDFLAASDEDAADGRLLVYWQGKRHEVALDRAKLPQRLEIADDLLITVVRVITNPTHDDQGLVQDDAAAPNPVVELAVTQGKGPDARLRTLFASAYSLLPPAAGLPDLLYRHPQLADPVGGGQGAYVQLLVGPDGRLHLRAFTRSSGAGPSLTVPAAGWEGVIAGGEGKAMTLRLGVRHLPQAVRMPEALAMRADKKDRATRWLELEVAHGGAAVRRWFARGDRAAVDVPGFGPVQLSYAKALYDLKERNGFAVVLDRFTAGKDPGGAGNATFASDVTVVTKDGTRTPALVTMNEPLHHDGVTLYQTAFFPETDDHGAPTGKDVSVFTVATDRGRILKYLGSIVLVAGILVLYLYRPKPRGA